MNPGSSLDDATSMAVALIPISLSRVTTDRLTSWRRSAGSDADAFRTFQICTHRSVQHAARALRRLVLSYIGQAFIDSINCLPMI